VKTDDVFLLHTANRALLNGKKRLPVGKARPGVWFVGAIPLISTVCGLILIVGLWWEEIKFGRLQDHGVKTVATVVGLHESSAPGDSHDPDTYSVTYHYTVNGRKYEEKAALDWFEYTDLSKGSRIEIRYDPQDPSVSKLEKRFKERELEGPKEIQTIFVYIIVMTLIGMFWLGAWYVRQLRPLRRLTREGRTLCGDIVECSGRSQGDDYQVTLAYRFTDPNGNEIANRAEAVRDDLKGAVLPVPGTPVMVYFVDSKTYAVL
jgi:hypothetical protein